MDDIRYCFLPEIPEHLAEMQPASTSENNSSKNNGNLLPIIILALVGVGTVAAIYLQNRKAKNDARKNDYENINSFTGFYKRIG